MDVCQFLAAGGAPKNDFNDSTLFFLPKDGTGLPPAHRPIAASNTDNRIIANVVRRKLESAVYSILDRSQTGFVRGRKIEEHIHFFNRKFYNALYSRYRDDLPAPGLDYPDDASTNVPREGGTDYYILFLDFAKAYDSVSRRFLFCLLEHVGIPGYYLNIIRALFHDVKAWPSLPGKANMHIRMPDGLKQGCPLSCLLFILAIDPLVSVLGRVPNTDPADFADDVAVGTVDPVNLVPALLHVDAWSRVSRCKPNVKKTKLLSTSAAPLLISHLLPLHWASLGYADSYVYLGVLIGRSIDVTMVYQRAVDKFVERARSFMPMQRALTISARVRMANTYLVPILSYLFRFYLMTTNTDRHVRATLKMWLIRGNVTNLDRLAAPIHLIGLSGPLHDPARVNLAALLSHRQIPAAPVMSGRYSMLMSDHVQHAAISFQALAGEPCPSGADRGAITGALLHKDTKPISRLVQTMGKRLARQGRPGSAKDLVRAIGANSLRLPGSMCSALRNHAFNIVHQCLFTGHRARRHGTRLECAFCGAEREDDCHLFVDCKVAKEAIASLRQRRRPLSRKAAAFLAKATVADHHLESPGLAVEDMRFLLCFSLAVWKTRRFFWHEGPRPTLTQGAARVVLEFESLCRNWTRGGRRNRDAEKRAFEAALKALPPHGVHVYTDGSSYGNPGPAGAGVAAYDADGNVQCLLSRSLGTGTNNSAELAAILDATEYLLEVREEQAGGPIFIFVDNRTAMAVALGRVVPSWGAGVATAVCRNVAALAETRSVWFIWVPGHAGVPGNEAADRLAKLGAAGVTGAFFDMSELPHASEPDVGPVGGCAGPSGACDDCLEVLRSQCARCARRGRRRRRVAPSAPSHRYNLRSRARRAAPSLSSGPDVAGISGAQPAGASPAAGAAAALTACVSSPPSPPVEAILDDAAAVVPSGCAPDSPCSWGYGSGFGSCSDVGSPALAGPPRGYGSDSGEGSAASVSPCRLADLAGGAVDAALVQVSSPHAEGGVLTADPAVAPLSAPPAPPPCRAGLCGGAPPPSSPLTSQCMAEGAAAGPAEAMLPVDDARILSPHPLSSELRLAGDAAVGPADYAVLPPLLSLSGREGSDSCAVPAAVGPFASLGPGPASRRVAAAASAGLPSVPSFASGGRRGADAGLSAAHSPPQEVRGLSSLHIPSRCDGNMRPLHSACSPRGVAFSLSPPPPQEVRGFSSSPPQEVRGFSSSPPQEVRGLSPSPPQEVRGLSSSPPQNVGGLTLPPPQDVRGLSSLPPSRSEGAADPKRRGRRRGRSNSSSSNSDKKPKRACQLSITQFNSRIASNASLRVGLRNRKRPLRTSSSFRFNLVRPNTNQPSQKKRKIMKPRTTKSRKLTSTHNRRGTAPPKGLECLGANFPT